MPQNWVLRKRIPARGRGYPPDPTAPSVCLSIYSEWSPVAAPICCTELILAQTTFATFLLLRSSSRALRKGQFPWLPLCLNPCGIHYNMLLASQSPSLLHLHTICRVNDLEISTPGCSFRSHLLGEADGREMFVQEEGFCVLCSTDRAGLQTLAAPNS